jgi:hypothetical protein
MNECEGHPAGPNDPMGETVYCDGSCALPDLHPLQTWRDEPDDCSCGGRGICTVCVLAEIEATA